MKEIQLNPELAAMAQEVIEIGNFLKSATDAPAWALHRIASLSLEIAINQSKPFVSEITQNNIDTNGVN